VPLSWPRCSFEYSVYFSSLYRSPLKPKPSPARVVGFTDGDTITVLVAEHTIKVRLAGIDTPERKQPWGSRAKQALSNKVFGENVEVRVVNTDRYGRTVGHVWIGDQNISREMIREGHAWVYRRYLDDKTLIDDETHTRNDGIGVWGLPELQRVPPWDWRRGKRKAKPKPELAPDQAFSCGTKRKCGEMVSCTEARFPGRGRVAPSGLSCQNDTYRTC
jgi:endonuclease YncB( thermonuclease family)